MKKIIFLCLAVITAGMVAGQGTVEVLRFSQVYHSGTARFSAMGGAFTALGGDPSVLTYNPGGLGVYRSTELSLTPHLLSNYNEATYDGKAMSDYRLKFGLSNIACIFSFDMSSPMLKYFNFGFAYNKTNHYSEASMLQGLTFNNTIGGNSMSQYFAMIANETGKAPAQLERNSDAWLGYEGWAIDYDTAGGRNEFYAPYRDGEEIHNEQRYTISGMMGEYDFSIGGNVADIFYFGATFGLVEAIWKKTVTLTEVSESLHSLDYVRDYDMNGTGINFKIGFVVTPLINLDYGSGLRLGAAVHTPTFIDMKDSYIARMKNYYEREKSTDPNEFEYTINTPARYMAGAAYVFAGETLRGIVSADYEYVDYSHARMREQSGYSVPNLLTINNDVSVSFKGASNLRFGGELGYRQYSLRAGYAKYGNPYSSDADGDGSVQMFSVGAGVKLNKMSYIDIAYTRSLQNDRSRLYEYNEQIRSNEVKYRITQNNIMFTWGVRF